MSHRTEPLKAIGAYVYAGGFSVGVRRAGFDVVAHLEGDGGYGVDSARLNWPDLPIHHGPAKWPLDELREAGISWAVANPPCAIFSPMGIATTQGKEAWRNDPRLAHWWDSFKVLERVRPRAWCLESVTQAYTKGREVIDEMTKRALMGGYSVTHLLLDARWCGIPQSRRRFFIIVHRHPELVGYHHNWAPPPIVADVLADVDEPGWHRSVLPKYVDALAATGPGERLCTAWQRLNPGYETCLNAQGKVAGRPSFQDRRLDPSEVMGAYIGDKYYHPTEDRMLGILEAKRLCGYPDDFQLAPPATGWPSLLARAVMPPVGYWLSNAIRQTLDLPDGAWGDRRVTLVDVREPDRPPVDLTPQYLDGNGRVRLRARADGTVSYSTPRTTAPPRPTAPLTPPAATTISRSEPVAALPPGVATAPTGAVSPLPPPSVTIERDDFDAADPAYAPRASEGSGQLIRRLWRETNLSPDELIAVVHANWRGRTTRVGDVYYNYRRLVQAGEPVREWPRRTRNEPRGRPRTLLRTNDVSGNKVETRRNDPAADRDAPAAVDGDRGASAVASPIDAVQAYLDAEGRGGAP